MSGLQDRRSGAELLMQAHPSILFSTQPARGVRTRNKRK